MHDLIIADHPIRRDSAGRYSLNDLYRASGGANRHRPSLWLANRQTREIVALLVNEISGREIPPRTSETETLSGREFLLREPPTGREFPPAPAPQNKQEFLLIPPVETTQKSGAWVVEELVYAYAMWVSPAFHLRVIRAYRALMTGRLAASDATLERTRQALAQTEVYWFTRRPHWPLIRAWVLVGTPYAATARRLGCRPDRVRRAVRGMIDRGLLDPRALATAQRGNALHGAIRRIAGWGQRPAPDRQLALALGGSHG